MWGRRWRRCELSTASALGSLGHEKIKETIDTYGDWLKRNRKGGLDPLDGEAAEITP